jgi:hypothetical protein
MLFKFGEDKPKYQEMLKSFSSISKMVIPNGAVAKWAARASAACLFSAALTIEHYDDSQFLVKLHSIE